MRRTQLISFLALAYGFSWCIAGVGASFGVDAAHPAYVLVAGLAMFGPAVAAVIQWRVIDRTPCWVMALHARLNKWSGFVLPAVLAACIVPLALNVSHMLGEVLLVPDLVHAEVSILRFSKAVSLLLGGDQFTAPSCTNAPLVDQPGSVILPIILVATAISAFTVNPPFLSGEEDGWRRHLFTVARRSSAAKWVAIARSVWGLWHAPRILMGHKHHGYRATDIVMMMMWFCTLLSALFHISRQWPDRIRRVDVLHGMINGSAGAIAFFAWDGHGLLPSFAGMAALAAVFVVCLVVLTFDRSCRRILFGPVTMP